MMSGVAVAQAILVTDQMFKIPHEFGKSDTIFGLTLWKQYYQGVISWYKAWPIYQFLIINQLIGA